MTELAEVPQEAANPLGKPDAKHRRDERIPAGETSMRKFIANTVEESKGIHEAFKKSKKENRATRWQRILHAVNIPARIWGARSDLAGQAEQGSTTQVQNAEPEQSSTTSVDAAEQNVENAHRRSKSERFRNAARRVAKYLVRDKIEQLPDGYVAESLNDVAAMRKTDGYESVYDAVQKVSKVALPVSANAETPDGALGKEFANGFMGYLNVPGDEGDDGLQLAFGRTGGRHSSDSSVEIVQLDPKTGEPIGKQKLMVLPDKSLTVFPFTVNGKEISLSAKIDRGQLEFATKGDKKLHIGETAPNLVENTSAVPVG